MRSETSVCDDIRRELSARLDHEADERLATAVDEHLRGCAACRSYERSLAVVRRQLRVQPAVRPPDLSLAIMSELRTRRGLGTPRAYLKTALVAALAAALVVGGTTLRFGNERPDVATASDVVAEIREAARHLDTYEATFEVVEGDPTSEDVGDTSTVHVSYRAPEMIRIETVGPTGREDLYIATPDSSFERRTLTCAFPSRSACTDRPLEVKTVGRQPLSAEAPSVTDIVLPIETLAASDAVDVVGTGQPLLGRNTLRLRMPYWQAHVLVDAVRTGSPRSFDPEASVDLWLDAENWFPLRFELSQPGRPSPALVVEATEVSERAVPAGTFEVPRRAQQIVDERFRSAPAPDLLPSFTAGLELYRAGVTAERHSLASYVNGLSWMTLKIAEDVRAPESLIAAEVVRLAEVGPVYYSPSGNRHARVVDVYDGERHLRLESNLPRATLLEVADSLPVTARAVDVIRRGALLVERVAPATVYAQGALRVPDSLPPGYRPVNATMTRRGKAVVDMVIRYSQLQNDYTGTGIVLTAAPGIDALPASSETFATYRVGETIARWSPLRGELEWVDGGVYRAVRVGDFRVELALRIARTM